MSADISTQLAEQVAQAFVDATPLRIIGGGSKLLLGRTVQGQALELGAHRGIVEYQPTELVITARAGTPLKDIEAALAECGQMFSFEPPHLGDNATLGGMVACGLSGPRRPHTCAVRDSMLGVKMINGRGEVLRFGGQVMKNVAGYDVSRLMVGAQGTLGVLLDVSLKVLPRPEVERSLQLECDDSGAIETMARLCGSSLPLSAACHLPSGLLTLRFSGVAASVDAALAEVRRTLPQAQLLGEGEAARFWTELRERRLPFFDDAAQGVWRLSLPPATAAFADELPGDCLLDWAGAQRWLKTDLPAEQVQTIARKLGGHATLYEKDRATFAPLDSALATAQTRIKQAFDPKGILNPGRLYEGL